MEADHEHGQHGEVELNVHVLETGLAKGLGTVLDGAALAHRATLLLGRAREREPVELVVRQYYSFWGGAVMVVMVVVVAVVMGSK